MTNNRPEGFDQPSHVRAETTIASLRICPENDCVILSGRHLLITYEAVYLDEIRAAAVSYTWGEFDRRRTAIGHDSEGRALEMELGQEWCIDDLKSTLVDISEAYNGCWLDQLCILQRDEDIRATLASIPQIYRVLDVVALMPGSPCRCFREAADLVMESWLPGNSEPQRNEAWAEFNRRARDCVNSVGLNSWFDRVWTRQELFYSRHISVRWTARTHAHCVRSIDDVRNLGKYAGFVYEERLREFPSPVFAYQAVQNRQSAFMASALQAMTLYQPLDDPEFGSRANPQLALARFFAGEIVQHLGLLHRDKLVFKHQCRRFLQSLSDLGLSTRKATKFYDYIISVWIDSPGGYNIPSDYKTLELACLLEDAVRQFERKTGYSIPVTAPAGLFGDIAAGGLWRPTLYLESEGVRNAKHVYGVIPVPAYPLPLLKGVTPLRDIRQEFMNSRSFRSSRYSELFEDAQTAKVIAALRPVVREWPQSTITKLQQGYFVARADFTAPRHRDHGTLDAIDDLFYQCLFDAQRGDWNIKEVDHHDLVYKMVAAALGLNATSCQRQGLHLMTSLHEPPCIGLMKSAVFLPTDISTDDEFRTTRHRASFATMCVVKPEYGQPCLLFEAAYVRMAPFLDGGGPTTVLDVAGVWVPTKIASFIDLQLMVHDSGRDAQLGRATYLDHFGAEWHRMTNDGPHNEDTQNEARMGERPSRFWPLCLLSVVVLFIFLKVLEQVLFAPLFYQVHPDSRQTCSVGPEYWRVRSTGQSL